MATKTYIGAATAVAQLNTYTFGGTYLTNETITVTYGSAAWTYTLTSGTIATFLPLLQTAYAALGQTLYPQFYEQISATDSVTHFTLTARTAGVPFTATISTNSVAGTINGGASSTGTATTASQGPNDISIAANWSPSGVPVNSDTVNLTGISTSLLYGLTALSGVTLTALTIDSTYTGFIGLPDNNPSGYAEYRQAYMQVGATTTTIGAGSGAQSQRIKLDFGSVQTTCSVYGTTTPVDVNVAASLLLKGTSSSNALYVSSGTVYSTMTLSILGVSYTNVPLTDVTITQTGAVTTLTQSGGKVTCSGNVTTWTVNGTPANSGAGCTPTLSGTATGGTVNVFTPSTIPITFSWLSNGTITTFTGSAGATLDCGTDLRARTLTNCNLEAGAAINDPGVTITFTNPFFLRACGLKDVPRMNLGNNIHLQRS